MAKTGTDSGKRRYRMCRGLKWQGLLEGCDRKTISRYLVHPGGDRFMGRGPNS